jgi:uncharacterized membrane protein
MVTARSDASPVPLAEQALGGVDGRRGACMGRFQARHVPQFSANARTMPGRPMSELSTKERARLRRDQFAYVDREGGEHLPIHDESHVRNALVRFNQTEFESKAARERARKKILRAADRFGIDVADAADVRQPTR